MIGKRNFRQEITTVGKDMEKKEPTYTVAGNVN